MYQPNAARFAATAAIAFAAALLAVNAAAPDNIPAQN